MLSVFRTDKIIIANKAPGRQIYASGSQANIQTNVSPLMQLTVTWTLIVEVKRNVEGRHFNCILVSGSDQSQI